jgi:GTP cyclohydrolase III
VSLSNIENLITYGDITLGVLRPIGCVVTAVGGDNCLAMLVRRRGETLAQFLTHLDQAIDKALTEDIYTDESTQNPKFATCPHGAHRPLTSIGPG